MGVECVVVFAHATGRTLVAPPAQNLTARAPNPHSQKRKLGFNDFFFTRTAVSAPRRRRLHGTAAPDAATRPGESRATRMSTVSNTGLEAQEGMHMISMEEFLQDSSRK